MSRPAIVATLAAGHSIETAARAAGMRPAHLRDLLTRARADVLADRDTPAARLARDTAEAVRQEQARCLATIREAAASDPRAAGWLATHAGDP